MAKDPMRCAYCRRILDKNGDSPKGVPLIGVRWYKVKHGYTHAGDCYDLQVKREISEPLFPVPHRQPFA